jgi:hypothetical protein
MAAQMDWYFAFVATLIDENRGRACLGELTIYHLVLTIYSIT